MTKAFTPRSRKVRVLATLGPASNTPEMIARLFEAGADAFRINMSHGDQASKLPVIAAIRALEKGSNRPTTILADLQGPKLRVGRFAEGKVMLETGSQFILDRSDAPATPPGSSFPPGDLRRDHAGGPAAAGRRQARAARRRA